MTKHILLIGNPGDKDADNYCAGVLKDLENYKNYFKSFAGGEWYDSEITCLVKPDCFTVRNELKKMAELDYSIIVFSGHGYSRDGQTYVELKPGEDDDDYCNDIPESEFMNSGRRLIILDCCRKNIPLINLDESVSEQFAKHFAMERSTRKTYESTLLNSAKINTILYSCSLNEYSQDDERSGGVYSYNLVKSACQLYDSLDAGKYYPATAAHNLASKEVTKISNNTQNPAKKIPRISSKEKLPPFTIKM